MRILSITLFVLTLLIGCDNNKPKIEIIPNLEADYLSKTKWI